MKKSENQILCFFTTEFDLGLNFFVNFFFLTDWVEIVFIFLFRTKGIEKLKDFF